MMGLFRRKSAVEKLQKKYEQLLKEAHQLSTSNRMMSDQKIAEAQLLLEEMEKLEAIKKSQ